MTSVSPCMGLFNGVILLIPIAFFEVTLASSGRVAVVYGLVPRVFLPTGACFSIGAVAAFGVIQRLLLVTRSIPKYQSCSVSKLILNTASLINSIIAYLVQCVVAVPPLAPGRVRQSHFQHYSLEAQPALSL